jgi:hypothetical protein
VASKASAINDKLSPRFDDPRKPSFRKTLRSLFVADCGGGTWLAFNS